MQNKNTPSTNYNDIGARFALASFIAWQNALAEATVNGGIPLEVTTEIAHRAEVDTKALVLGRTLNAGGADEVNLDVKNEFLRFMAGALATSIEDIAAEMEAMATGASVPYPKEGSGGGKFASPDWD